MKNKLRKLLLAFSFGLLFASTACELQEDVVKQSNYEHDFKLYEKSYDELLNDKKFMSSIAKLPKRNKKGSSTNRSYFDIEDEFGFDFDRNRVNVVEDEGHISYTFYIKRDSVYSDHFENLVIQVDTIDQTSAFILKHTLLDEMMYLPDHNTYSLKSDIAVTPLYLDDKLPTTSSKMVYECHTTYSYTCSGGGGGCNADWHPVGYACNQFTPGCIFRTGSTTQCGYYDLPDSNVGGGGSPSSGGGGGGGPRPRHIRTNTNNQNYYEYQDPCSKTNTSIQAANDLLHKNSVQQGMDNVLKGKLDDNSTNDKEWAVAIGQLPNNNVEVTQPLEGNTNSGEIPYDQLTGEFIGDGHNHPFWGLANPSGGDFYKMLALMQNYPNYKYRYTYGKGDGGNNNVYALVVHDRQAALNFLQEFPQNQNFSAGTRSFDKESKLGAAFDFARKQFQKGAYINDSGESYTIDALALAYILDKHNVGISLAKADSNGNLKKVNVNLEEITNSLGQKKPTFVVTNCL